MPCKHWVCYLREGFKAQELCPHYLSQRAADDSHHCLIRPLMTAARVSGLYSQHSDLTLVTDQSTGQYRWWTGGPGRQVRYHGSDLTLVTGLSTEQYR